jgi:hypothetical protein
MKSPGISQTKRYIIALDVKNQSDIIAINHKLPQEAEKVTGVYFSIKSLSNISGVVSLKFSEGISSPLLHRVVSTKTVKRKKTNYIPVCETVSEASTLQGYYADTSTIDLSYSMLIYIEYIPHKEEKK